MRDVKPLLGATICLLLMPMVGCSAGRADARVAYWTEQARLHMPTGIPVGEAQAFLAAHGLQLRCCMSGPGIDKAYSAMDPDVGRFGWIEYSALIVVDVTPDRRVDRVRVVRVGVGP